jgi:hypothetical protein
MSQEQETTTTAGAEASALATTTQASESSDSSVASTLASEAPAWSPDFTYEFDGKKREIDPLFRGIIKDKETNEKVRDYIQRADAAAKYRDKMQGYEKEWKPVVDQVTKMQQWYEKGDHDRIFKSLGYTDQEIFQYVKNKLQQAQMPEQERAAIEAKKMAELEKEQFQEQYSMKQSELQQELARVTHIEMDLELAKPEYTKIQQAYDKAYGDGAFKDLVIERGAYMVDQAGQHVRPSDVLKSVARDFTPFLSASQPQEEQTQQQTQKPKVIPNVGKGSGSPARTAIRSMADLKKRAAQLGD